MNEKREANRKKGQGPMRRIERAARAAVVLAVAAGVAACDSFLDVNEDPNNAEDVEMELTLPGMLITFAHDVLGPTPIRYQNMVGPTGWGTEWLQQWSDNRDEHTYAQFQWYEVANLDTNGYWGDSYNGVMNEANNIMGLAAPAERWQHHGIAKLIMAWNLALLTDAFGPAPFAEAFDPLNPNPAYQSQEELYPLVFQMVDEAIEEMQMADPEPPAENDLLFEGDLNGWIRLAHSLKARLNLRVAYAPGENTQQRAQAALEALALGIRSPEEAPTISYEGGQGYRQPWYEFEDENDGSGERTRSSAWFIGMLKENQDPRLPIMANPAELACPEDMPYLREDCQIAEEVTTEPIYRGNLSGGVGEPDSAISRLGSFFTADSADHVWFTYEDTKFLEAEAQLILGGPAAADAAYREGIRANMERLGVAEEDIAAYLAAVPPLGAQGNPLEELITEKFKANFLRDEVWHDWRRTGHPVVPPVPQRVIAGIPQRLRTPADEVQFNADRVAETGISTGLDGMLVEVWWASGSPPGF